MRTLDFGSNGSVVFYNTETLREDVMKSQCMKSSDILVFESRNRAFLFEVK